jgi:glycosyltransferase involved in cell wall biosynthesis
MSKVIVVSTAHFPDGDAGAIKYINMAPMFSALGYSTLFVGYGYSPYKVCTPLPHGSFVSLRKYPRHDFLSKSLSRVGYHHQILNYAKKQTLPGDVLIVSPFFSLRSCRSLSRYAKAKGAKIIFSVVEYFSESEFPLHGTFSSAYRNCKDFFDHFRPQDGSILAISSYIAHCFEPKGISTLVIPFAFAPSYVSAVPHQKSGNKLELMYAGRPGRKDSLFEMIKGISLLNEADKQKVHLSVYGVGKDWISKQVSSPDQMKDILSFATFYGSVNNSEVTKAYAHADFAVLLRDSDARFAKAGFPTKVSESLWHGVPVLANYSSDLAMYLTDGLDSIEVKGKSASAFSMAVSQALKLSPDTLEQMHISARKTAENKLNILNFASSFKNFLQKA